MSRYAIWDKISNIITPTGAIFTPNEWIEKYPVAEYLDIVCSGGVVNGGFFGIYEEMKQMYESQGCDFSGCSSKEEVLLEIELFENNMILSADSSISADERIAAALEYQVMTSLPDETV